MNFDTVRSQIKTWVKRLQSFASEPWYAPLLSLLAGLDNLILIVPTDGLLISSSMLRPKQWFWFACCVTVGSTLGAVALAALVETMGLPWILSLYPALQTSEMWKLTHDFFQDYGLLVTFIVSITPLMQQPAVVLAALGEAPLPELALVVFIGRFIKFLIMAYLGSHAPRLLSKIWGVQEELREVGLKD